MAGGKWTTYRRMAADALDTACARGRLGVCGPCRTAHLKVLTFALCCAADLRHD